MDILAALNTIENNEAGALNDINDIIAECKKHTFMHPAILDSELYKLGTDADERKHITFNINPRYWDLVVNAYKQEFNNE